MEGLKHGDNMTFSLELSGGGDSGWTGSDNSNLAAGKAALRFGERGRHFFSDGDFGLVVDTRVFTAVVSSKTFETADSDGITAHFTEDATEALLLVRVLALVLLGAHTTGDAGAGVGGLDEVEGVVDTAFADAADEATDIDGNGATLLALGVRALEAATGFVLGGGGEEWKTV